MKKYQSTFDFISFKINTLNWIFFYFILAGLMIVFAGCSGRLGPEEKQVSQEPQADTHLTIEPPDLSVKIIEDENDDAQYIERARWYLDQQQPDSAIRDLLFAIDINPDVPDYHILLSDAYLVLGNPDKSRESLDKALGMDPENSEARQKLAELLLIMKNYDELYKVIGRLLKKDAINPAAYCLAGYGLLEQGDTLKAIKNFRTAVDQDQENFDALAQLGVIYSAKRDPLAVEYFNRAIIVKPEIIETYYRLALFFQENGQVDRAVSTYEAIIGMQPDYKYAIYNLGYIYLVYYQDFVKSVDYFTKVLEYDPDYTDAIYNRGYSYEQSGQKQKAYDDYQTALRKVPNYSKALEGIQRLESSEER